MFLNNFIFNFILRGFYFVRGNFFENKFLWRISNRFQKFIFAFLKVETWLHCRSILSTIDISITEINLRFQKNCFFIDSWASHRWVYFVLILRQIKINRRIQLRFLIIDFQIKASTLVFFVNTPRRLTCV